MTTLPFSGATTATHATHDINANEPDAVTLPFGAGGQRIGPTVEAPVEREPEAITPAPEPATNPEASTFEPGGWRPMDDRRDLAGYDFAEWSVNCARVVAGQSILAPAHPRQRGLFPPIPAWERKPEVAEAPDARKAVTANGVKVTRTDAYKRKPSKKTRDRKTAETGAKWVTGRDLAVVEEVTAWGYLSRTQVALLLGYSPAGMTRRLNKLVTIGLLDRQYGIDGHFRYMATAAGRRLAGMERYSAVTISMMRWDHHDATVAAALLLKRQHPDAVIITEREATVAAYGPDGKVGPGGTLSPRLLRLAPWLTSQAGGDYSVWAPRIFSNAGTVTGRKHPDLLIAGPGRLPQASEVELTAKSRRSAYRDVVVAYRKAAADKHLDPTVLYLTSPASPLSAKRLRVLLEEAGRSAGSRPSSPLRFEIIEIPASLWLPTAARIRA